MVFRGAFADPAVVDAATAVFEALIAEQRAGAAAAGDHFATGRQRPGLERAGEARADDPEVFADYYANDVIAAGSRRLARARLPGHLAGERGQSGRCAQSGTATTTWVPVHAGSCPLPGACAPALAGADAAGRGGALDMPVESGPTLYLPHSHSTSRAISPGRPEFQAYFEEHHVQLPLARATRRSSTRPLFHAAGTNRSTDIRRMANLLQISSAFGRAMESVDRVG